jgi:phage tail-like protein
MPSRPFLIVRTADQWMRSSHVRTALDRAHGILQLADAPEARTVTVAPAPAAYAGLAFDRECRLYRATAQGQVLKYLWSVFAPDARSRRRIDGTPLFDVPRPGADDQFAPVPAAAGSDIRALAVDADGRLFVADAAGRSVVVIDLLHRRVLRHVQFAPNDAGAPARPIDLAVIGRRVYVLLDDPVGIALLRSRRPVRRAALPAGVAIADPARLAVGRDGRLFVLERAGMANARVISYQPASPAVHRDDPEPFATDLEFDGDGALVIARHPGDTFERVRDVSVWEKTGDLQATGYDGSGIVRRPDGRIGFWTGANTFRPAIPARPHFVPDGRVTTYRLDSGSYQTVWGRMFVDACVPRGTSIRVRAIASDEPPEGATQPAALPSNIDPRTRIERRDLSPLLPLALDAGPIDGALFERPRGRELPWSFQESGDRFETYESPIRAARGRFLLVTHELHGTSRQSPRVRALRLEHPAHDYLQRLPKTFSRDAAAESFLRRFLSPLEGVFGELESRAIARLALIDARSAPQDVLPWLAGFVGLVVDERLRPDRRRRLVADAVPLLRLRGTVRGLRRFIALAIGIRPHIIEHFTLRGFGGPVLGYTGADMPTRSVLGSGFRIGGALDSALDRPLAGEPIDAIRRRAHRFTVILPSRVSAEERGILDHILEIHRPAHTVGGYCTA